MINFSPPCNFIAVHTTSQNFTKNSTRVASIFFFFIYSATPLPSLFSILLLIKSKLSTFISDISTGNLTLLLFASVIPIIPFLHQLILN